MCSNRYNVTSSSNDITRFSLYLNARFNVKIITFSLSLMPSYASVAAKDLPPSTEWPQPDPNLLSTEASSGTGVVDDSAKVAVVSSDFKENPQSEFTENIRQNVPQESSGTHVPMPTLRDGIISQPIPAPQQPSKAHRAGHKAKAEAVSIWEHATNFLLRPGVAGGLIGLGGPLHCFP